MADTTVNALDEFLLDASEHMTALGTALDDKKQEIDASLDEKLDHIAALKAQFGGNATHSHNTPSDIISTEGHAIEPSAHLQQSAQVSQDSWAETVSANTKDANMIKR